MESERTAQATHAEALQRDREDLERLQRRQEMMYEDRLDGRIDAARYDHKVAQLGAQQEQIQQRIRAGEAAMPLPTSQAVDLGALMSRVAEQFLEQPASEQRKMLHVVLQQASRKGGALQISWQEPFEALRLAERGAPSELPRCVDQELPTGTPANVMENQPGESSGEEQAVNLQQSGTTSEAA